MIIDYLLINLDFGCRDEDGRSKNNWKEKLQKTMNQWKKCLWSKFKWSSTVSPLWHGEGFVSSNDRLHHRGLKVADLSYLWLFGCFSCCQFWILQSGTDARWVITVTILLVLDWWRFICLTHSCQHNLYCLTWFSSQVSTTFLAIDTALHHLMTANVYLLFNSKFSISRFFIGISCSAMFQDEEFDLDLDDDPFPDNPVAPPSRPSDSADPPSVMLLYILLLFYLFRAFLKLIWNFWLPGLFRVILSALVHEIVFKITILDTIA